MISNATNRGAAVLALCLLMPPTAALHAQRQPLTHEAMWQAKRVGAPLLSPDGRWVAFSLTEPSYTAADQTSDLWLVPADGSAPPRRLTFTRGGESGATWSPDSRRIAFSARREGDDAAQIYVIDVAGGGEAQRVTTWPLGARSPQWSPDGTMLLFAAGTYRGAVDDTTVRRIAAERRNVRHRARVYDTFPIRNWDRWLDDVQQTLLVQRADPVARPRNLLGGTSLVVEPGFGGSLGSGSEQIVATWAPDGRSVVFAATTDRTSAAFAPGTMSLYSVGIEGGEPARITPEGDVWSNPQFSPDGRHLYATFNPNNDKVYNNTRIAVFSWPDFGAPNIVSRDVDRSIGSFSIAPDGRSIWFTSEGDGLERVYSMPAEGGRERLVSTRDAGVYTNLAVAGSARAPAVVANWGSAVNPAEIVRIDLRSGAHTPLTSYNVALAEGTDWRSVEHFSFNSSRGARIHNMIVRPANFDPNRRYPLFVLMHGGPHSMWRDELHLRWNYHLLSQPGFVILLTNYTGSTGFGEAFAQRIQFDPLEGPALEINEAADEAIRRFPFIDASRQAAGGASYGGHLAYWLQGVTERYRALIAHAGAMNMETQWGTSDVIFHREINFGGPVWEQGPVWVQQNPIRRAASFRTPMLITVGELDYRVPLNTTLEAWSVLQRQQVPSRLIVFPDENHWILNGENSRFFYREVRDWLTKYLLEGTAR